MIFYINVFLKETGRRTWRSILSQRSLKYKSFKPQIYKLRVKNENVNGLNKREWKK